MAAETLGNLWALALLAAAGIVLWRIGNRVAERGDGGFLGNTVLATVALRGFWSFAQHNLFGRYYKMIGEDTLTHFGTARQMATLWREGLSLPQLPRTLSESHVLLIDLKTACLVYLFGPSPMLPETVTIIANASISIATYLVCRQIGATRTATRVAVLLNAFLPSLVFWSTQDLKDPILAACGAWALYALLMLSQGRKNAFYPVLLVAMNLLAVTYRPYVGILLMAGQGCALVYMLRLPQTLLGRLTRVLIFLALTPLVLMFGVHEMQDTYGQDMNLEYANNQFNSFREDAVAGGTTGSEYEIPLTASSPAMAILQLPLRIPLLLLTPIPLFPGSLRRIFMYPEMWFVYLWVLPRFWRGVREAWRKNPQALMSILLMVTPVICAYALKTSVSGEAARMRIQFLPELLIFAGVGHVVLARERVDTWRARQHHKQWLARKQCADWSPTSGCQPGSLGGR